MEGISILPTAEDLQNDKYVSNFKKSDNIEMTFSELFEQCKNDHKELAELTITVDHLMWECSNINDIANGGIYMFCRSKALTWADNNLGHEELSNFYKQID